MTVSGDGNPTSALPYSIVFVGGEGVLTGVVSSETAPAGDNDSGGSVNGFVSAIPTAGNCVQGATAFTVTVEALILEPPTGS